MVKARPVGITATNWNGFYVGGFFGGSAGRTDVRFGDPATDSTRPWASGVFGGGQLGYNYQFSNSFVLGFEGDIGAANIRRADRRHQRVRRGPDLGLFRGEQDELGCQRDRPPWLCLGACTSGRQGRRGLRTVA